MKFIAIALLTTLVSTITPVSAFLFAQREAPDMVVYFANELATNTSCTENELNYIDSKILPDLDMTLFSYNYMTPDWEMGTYGMRRDLAVSTPNCDFCKRLYPRNLCNQMYNCRMRRQLVDAGRIEEQEENEDRELVDYSGLISDLEGDCQYNLARLSYSWWLSRTCRSAIRGAICHVEVVAA